MGQDRVIGLHNRLPWHMPADMRWFRKNTLGKTILMGRKTFESFGSKPLAERKNIVISREPDYQAKGCEVYTSIDQAVNSLSDTEELMVIGGANIYTQMLPQAQRLYLTYIQGDFQGDSFFPQFDESEWRIHFVEEHQKDEKNPYDYCFVILERL